MIYEPWETFKEDAEIINIENPPCKHCIHWKPQRHYFDTLTGLVYDGVVLCHNTEMHKDFSCYEPKEDNN